MLMADLLMDILGFLARFRITGYEMRNTGMDTATGKVSHTLTLKLEG
jgi:hypothetical protein